MIKEDIAKIIFRNNHPASPTDRDWGLLSKDQQRFYLKTARQIRSALFKGDEEICPDCIDGKVFNIQHPSTLDPCPKCKGTGKKPQVEGDEDGLLSQKTIDEIDKTRIDGDIVPYLKAQQLLTRQEAQHDIKLVTEGAKLLTDHQIQEAMGLLRMQIVALNKKLDDREIDLKNERAKVAREIFDRLEENTFYSADSDDVEVSFTKAGWAEVKSHYTEEK